MFPTSAFRRRRAEIAKSRRKGEEKPRGDPGTQVHYQLTVIIAQTDTHKHKFLALTQSEKDYMAILLEIFSPRVLSAVRRYALKVKANKWNVRHCYSIRDALNHQLQT